MNVMNVSFGKMVEVRRPKKENDNGHQRSEVFVNPLSVQSITKKEEDSYEVKLMTQNHDKLPQKGINALSNEINRLKNLTSKREPSPIVKMGKVTLDPDKIESINLSASKRIYPGAYDGISFIKVNMENKVSHEIPLSKSDEVRKIIKDTHFVGLGKSDDESNTYFNPDKVEAVKYFMRERPVSQNYPIIKFNSGARLFSHNLNVREVVEKINEKLD